jgi:hypothetical protein
VGCLGGLRGIGPALAEEALGSKSFRAVREGILLFASKARCGPIPLRLAYLALRGTGPSLAEEARGRRGFRAARWGFCCSPPRLAADRSRSAWAYLALRGTGPSLAEEARGRRGFRAARWGFCCSPPRLAADRSRCRFEGCPRVGIGDRLTPGNKTPGDEVVGPVQGLVRVDKWIRRRWFRST